jgi:hypothetical protein
MNNDQIKEMIDDIVQTMRISRVRVIDYTENGHRYLKFIRSCYGPPSVPFVQPLPVMTENYAIRLCNAGFQVEIPMDAVVDSLIHESCHDLPGIKNITLPEPFEKVDPNTCLHSQPLVISRNELLGRTEWICSECKTILFTRSAKADDPTE